MNKEATVRLGSQLHDIQLLKQVDDILDSVIDSYVLTKKEMLFDEDDDRIIRAYTFNLKVMSILSLYTLTSILNLLHMNHQQN